MAWGKTRARRASSAGWAKKPKKPRSKGKKWGIMFANLREWIFLQRCRYLLWQEKRSWDKVFMEIQ